MISKIQHLFDGNFFLITETELSIAQALKVLFYRLIVPNIKISHSLFEQENSTEYEQK